MPEKSEFLETDQFEVLDLEPPHGFLMANGKQTAVAVNIVDKITDKTVNIVDKTVNIVDTSKAYLIISNGEAFGVATFEEPAQIKTKEFDTDEWLNQHRVTPRERRQWWPDSENFYIYRLKDWQPFEGIKLYEDGKVIDEPKLTAKQWKIISAAKQLPKQIIIENDFIELTADYSVLCGDKGFYNREAKAVFDATFNRDVNHTASKNGIEEAIPLYSLALVRNPRMRVSKKNLAAEGGPEAKKQEDENMPYRIIERDDEYCLINTETEEVMDCHKTEAEAEAQLVALNINVVAEEENAAYTDKPKKRKPHKKEMFGTEQSIDGRLSFIRGQFDERFSTENNYVWANDIFESFLVAEDDGRLFRVGYMDINDEIIFAPREQWVEVERGYRPKGFKVLATGLKRKPKKDFEQPSSSEPQPNLFGRLKLAAKNILEIISLAESREKESEAQLFMTEAGIAQKTVNGELWHFTYSTNAFRDREGEIFSTKALEKYVTQSEENEDKGFFNLWHINVESGNFNTDFAKKQWQGVTGRFLVEAGPYLIDEKGRAARKFFEQFGDRHPEIAPEGWGCSPEFKYLPEERATGTYENIWITRTSTLPKMAAANIWTETRQLARSKNMALSDQQKKAAEEMFGEDFVTRMMKEAEAKTAELEGAGVAHKGEAETETETETAETPEPQPPEIQLNIEDLATEIGKQFTADISPLAEAITQMATELKELKEWKTKQEENQGIKDKTETPRYVLEWKRASEQDETIVTDADDLKGQKPKETKAGSNDAWGQVFNK